MLDENARAGSSGEWTGVPHFAPPTVRRYREELGARISRWRELIAIAYPVPRPIEGSPLSGTPRSYHAVTRPGGIRGSQSSHAVGA